LKQLKIEKMLANVVMVGWDGGVMSCEGEGGE
jgi:hypothetical protein